MFAEHILHKGEGPTSESRFLEKDCSSIVAAHTRTHTHTQVQVSANQTSWGFGVYGEELKKSHGVCSLFTVRSFCLTEPDPRSLNPGLQEHTKLVGLPSIMSSFGVVIFRLCNDIRNNSTPPPLLLAAFPQSSAPYSVRCRPY